MLREIIRKEILDNILSPKFVFTFLICTILILLSLYTGINNYISDQKEYQINVSLSKKRLENVQDYLDIQSQGVSVVKSPQVLSIIVSGIQKAVGRLSNVRMWEDPKLVDSKYTRNPVSSKFSEFDLKLIVKVIISFFVILFTHNAIVGEKEQGTLRLILSNNIPRYKLILGKIIGCFISLIIPLSIPCLRLSANILFFNLTSSMKYASSFAVIS